MIEQILGFPYSTAFFSAMMHEGGRVESENQIEIPIADWFPTYVNL